MTSIFIIHAREDNACVELMRSDFENKGYTILREPAPLSLASVFHARTIQQAILRSAVLVLVWSQHAARSNQVEEHVFFAQRLKKPVFSVVLDNTPLQSTFVVAASVNCQTSCADAAVQLIQLPQFPRTHSSEPLFQLYELITQDKINTRKDAVEQAATMLQQGQQREAVLAVLDYVAHHDGSVLVQQKAQAVLDTHNRAAQTTPVPSFLNPEDRRHMFAVSCKDGHVNYFDKREVCVKAERVIRSHGTGDPAELDKLVLPCRTPGCVLTIVTYQDCEGYKSK